MPVKLGIIGLYYFATTFYLFLSSPYPTYDDLRENYIMFVIRLIIICSTLSLLTSMVAVPVIPPMS